MSKHTPGPWTVKDDRMEPTRAFPRGRRTVGVGDADSDAGSGVCQINRLYEEWEANARLIASAPELLAVLKVFVKDIDAVGIDQTAKDWPDLVLNYHTARAAIARAEGGES